MDPGTRSMESVIKHMDIHMGEGKKKKEKKASWPEILHLHFYPVCMVQPLPSAAQCCLPMDQDVINSHANFTKCSTVINFIRFTNTVPLIFFYSLNPFHHLIAQKVMDFGKKERLITINPVALSLLDARLMKLIFLQDLYRKSFPKEKNNV